MPQLTKTQFIILAIIIIGVTVGIIVGILSKNSNNNNDSDTNSNVVSNSGSNILPSNNNNDNNNIPNNIDDNEQNIDNREIEINTKTNNEVLLNLQNRLEVVMSNKNQHIFKNMFTPTKMEIEQYIGLDTTNLDSYIIRMNQSKFSSEMYMVLKPFDEYKEQAKADVKKFLLAIESAWQRLDEEQYNLILQRTAIERNGYLIYIISIDNDVIMHEIRKFI